MTDRVSCGTIFGVQLHRENSEPLCSWCQMGERARTVASERSPVPEPTPAGVADLIQEAIHALACALGTPARLSDRSAP